MKGLIKMSILAINGGKPDFSPSDWNSNSNNAIKWPIYTQEDEAAIVDVLHKRQMSGTDITKQFEKAYNKNFSNNFDVINGASHGGIYDICRGNSSL